MVRYEVPEMEIVRFDTEDIITASNPTSNEDPTALFDIDE